MGKSVYSYDPDEENVVKIPAWKKPKNELQKRALKACRRPILQFKSREERKEWNTLEDKTYGSEERHILYAAWIVHNIEECEKANALSPRPVRTFKILLAMIENENRRVDWEAGNAKKIMDARSSAVKSRFARKESG